MAFKNEGHSHVVSHAGKFSNQLREDLKLLYKLKSLILSNQSIPTFFSIEFFKRWPILIFAGVNSDLV